MFRTLSKHVSRTKHFFESLICPYKTPQKFILKRARIFQIWVNMIPIKFKCFVKKTKKTNKAYLFSKNKNTFLIFYNSYFFFIKNIHVFSLY